MRLRERVQIGRTDERQGFWSGSLHADVNGEPLFRHRIELGAGSVAHDDLGAPLASVSELRYPESRPMRWAPCSNWPTAVVWPPGRATGSSRLARGLFAFDRRGDLLELLDPGAGVCLLLGDGQTGRDAAQERGVHESSVVILRLKPTR